MTISRRIFLGGVTGLLGGCSSSERLTEASGSSEPFSLSGLFPGSPETSAYAAVGGEPYPVPAVDLTTVKQRFLRREVAYDTDEKPGTIVIDSGNRYAYLVRKNGRAIRYGVGVGKTEAFQFKGEAVIARKAAWPRWTPTSDMIEREPRYVKYAGGMDGGTGNPLGARAMYLYKDGRDTLFRLHGTLDPSTIGSMVSSGCIRFINQDVIDLYRRVPVGTRVVVLESSGSLFG